MDAPIQPQTITDYLVNRSAAELDAGSLDAENKWLNSGRYNNGFNLLAHTGSLVDDAASRRMGLDAYVTQDMSEQSAQLTEKLFGKTNPDNNSETAFTMVGRALASSHQLARNPEQFINIYGAEYGVTMPSDWDSDIQLYASIGQQYAQKRRTEMQNHLAKEEERRQLRDEELEAEVGEGVNRVLVGKNPTPKQWEGMKKKYALTDSELTDTLTRVKTAYEIYSLGRGREWAKALEEVDATKKRVQEAEAGMAEPHDLSQAEGLLEKGNIDPYTRKVEHRADGSIATVESFSVNLNGKEVLLPSVINGKKVSEEVAIEHYRKTGEHLGIFDTPENATAYAQKFHENQAVIYGRAERRAELKQALADGGIARMKAIGGAVLSVTPLIRSQRVLQNQIAEQLVQDPIAEQIFYNAIVPIAKEKAKRRNALGDIAQNYENIIQDVAGRPGEIIGDIVHDITSQDGRKWYDSIPFASRSALASYKQGIIANIESIEENALAKRKLSGSNALEQRADEMLNAIGTGFRALGDAAPYMGNHLTVAAAAFSDFAKRQRSEYQNQYYVKRGNTYVRGMTSNISWWEENGLPALRAAGNVAAYKAVGAANLYASKAAAPLFERWGATRIGSIAERVVTSRAGAVAAGLTESAAVLEEISLVDNAIQRVLDVAGVPFGVEDKREGLQGFRQMRADLAEAWGTPGKIMRGEQVRNWNFVAGTFAFGICGVKQRLVDNAAESSFWNTLKVNKEEQRYIKSSRTQQERADRFTEVIAPKMRENPEAYYDTLVKAGQDLASKESVMQLVRDNYGQKIIELSGGKANRREDGNYDIELKVKDKEGNDKTETYTWTEEQFGSYIAEHYNREAISALTELQSRVRGERLTRAAENRDPWLRLAEINAFDADIAKTIQDGQITEKTVRAIAESCRRRIEEWTTRYTAEGRGQDEARRMAEQKTVGSTGVALGTLAKLDADFAAREDYARATGELGSGDVAATRAFLASRGLGEVTMAFVRGEVTEADVLHELIEARTRTILERDPDAAQAMKEALVRINNDLKNNLTGRDSLLPPGKTAENITPTDIIEAMSHLAEADFLTFHESLDLATETHAALEAAKEHLQDLQSINALAEAWKAYTQTEAGQTALTENSNLLQNILEQSRAYVGDVYADAEKQSMDAARAIIEGRDAERAAARDALLRRAEEDEKPLTPEQEAAQPENPLHYGPTEAKDSLTGTRLSEDTFKTPLDTDPETGEMAPRPNAERVTEPDGAGRGLAGGVADKLPNGHVLGAARVADLTRHAVLGTKRAKQNIDARDEAAFPVLCFRAADGTLRAIDHLGKLEQAERNGGTFVEVEVVDESPAFTAAEARRTEQEYAIRMHCASAANILRHIEEHGLTRADAVERGLVTLDATGQETAASAIAWQLKERGSYDLRRALLEGKLSTKDAARICDIAPGDAELQAAVMKWKQDRRNMRWSTIEQRAAKYRAERKTELPLGESSFGMTGYRERMSLHDLLREQRVSDLIARADRIAFVGRSVLGGKTVDERAVNRLLAQLIGTHKAIEQEFANDPYARAEMMDTMKAAASKLRAMRDIMEGKFDTADVKALGEEENAKRIKAVGRGEKVQYVAEYLRDTEGDLLRSAARLIEDQEIDAYMRELDALIADNAPALKASGRSRRAKNSVAAVEKAARLRTMMEVPKYEADRRIDDLNARIVAAKGEKDGSGADEAHATALQHELNEWMTYGALRERGLHAVRKGAAELRQYLATEKQKWQQKQADDNARITANRDAIKEAVPVLDSAKLGNAKLDKNASTIKQIIDTVAHAATLDDLLIRMSNIPGVGRVAKRWQLEASRKRTQYAVTLHNDITNEHTYLAEKLGLKTDQARAMWLENATTINKTDVTTDGVLKTEIGTITLQEAHRITKLTPEERQRERNHNRNQTNDGQPYPDERAVASLKTRLEKRSFVDDNISYANYGGKRDNSVRSSDMRLSRMQAANLVLLAEQKSYVEQLNAAGYSKDVIDQLRAYAGQDVMDYAHWCRDYLQNIGTKEIFEQREGVPFPAEENYWPGHFLHSDISNTESSFIAGANVGRGIYTFLITRRLHNIQPDTTLGVNEIFRTAIQAHRRYQAVGDLTTEIRRTFADSITSGRMRAIMGDRGFEYLKAALPVLDASYTVDAVACRAERSATARFMTSSIMTFLPGSIKPIAFSLASVLTARAADGMGTRRYMAELAKQSAVGTYHGLEGTVKTMLRIRSDDPSLPMNPHKILQLDAFKARNYNDGLYNRLVNQPQGTKFSRLDQIANSALSKIGQTDIWANAVSMSVLYNKTYAELTERYPDMSDAVKRRHCEDVVESTLRLASQPIDPADKSIRYSSNTDPYIMWLHSMTSDVWKAFSVMKTIAERDIATAHYLRHEDGFAAAARRTGLYLKAGYSYLMPLSLLLQGVNISYQGLIGNIPSPSEDPEGFRSWLIQQGIVAATLGGLIESLPFYGTLYRGAYNTAVSLMDEEDRGTTMAAGRTNFTSFTTEGLAKFLYDIYQIQQEEKDWDEESWVRLSDAIRFFTSSVNTLIPRDSKIGATIRGTTNAINTANNFVRPLLQRAKATANDD